MTDDTRAETRLGKNGLRQPFLILMAISWATSALAQGEALSHGYVFLGPAGEGRSAYVQAGGGGEKVWSSGFGFGIEAGGMGRAESETLGFFSVNAVKQFPLRSSRIIPFATGGLSAFGNCCGTAGGYNAGGGVNYWFRERVGLRMESRHHFFEEGSGLWGVRVGIAFR